MKRHLNQGPDVFVWNINCVYQAPMIHLLKNFAQDGIASINFGPAVPPKS